MKGKPIIVGTALCLLLLFLGVSLASAQTLMIASAAGYKKPVSEAIRSFEKATGIKTDAAFGNIQMVSSQAKQTGEISCIIGDRKFLTALGSTVAFVSYEPIGKGVLVLAYRKGVSLDKVEDMASDKVKTVFMPQDKKAIYGIAGTEALKSYGYTSKLAGKITQVATVPQVVSYLIAGEADAGFINLTEAMANKERLGGYLVVPEDRYTEILIVAGVVKGFENKPETKKFTDYLKTREAKGIFGKYGVK
ncbi:MAG TPA: molybdate ABC transporter substrate-binding protein [Syntrophorhabdaceae bacterium]|nr:molybdate ABC transporter substrate-binding protein [Syntrophorhabdaceae bacterium]HOD75194.1 molybdate ABC transporter substrate-binding protein [Syntrophorhabdaceae bacterium]